MNLKAKIYEQGHKEAAAEKLAARIAILKGKGAEEKIIEKDALVKKLKATIRKSNRRLKQVATMEKLKEQKRSDKEKKIAAQKEAQKEASAQAPKKKAGKETKKESKPKRKKETSGADE